jgi:formate hydrogenlyase transcriptional activator
MREQVVAGQQPGLEYNTKRMTPDDPNQRQEFEGRAQFETLLSDISARLVAAGSEGLENTIRSTLEAVRRFFGADRCALCAVTDGLQTVRFSHIVHTDGVSNLFGDLNLSLLFPWVRQRVVVERQTLALARLADLPPEAAVDRANFQARGTRSILCIPVQAAPERLDLILVSNVRGETTWPEEYVPRLRLLGEMLVNTLERQHNETRLHASEALLRAGADLAGLSFYEMDFQEGVAHVDDRFRSLCGSPPGRALGLEPMEFWMEHLHPDDRGRVIESRRQLHEGQVERLSLDYRFLNPVRGQVWIHHLAAIATRDAEGRPIKTFGVLRDITERRRGEEALRQSYAEIERLKDRLQAESEYLKAEIRVVHSQGEVTGQSAVIRKVLRLVEQVAPTDSSVLVRGETGTGKELVAQAIHRLSPRGRHVMVKVNCAALPSGLVESELFGREKGAFTGALARQVGRFEVADGSTIFLDEVGELPPDVQVKLLRVLQGGEFERLGSPRTVKVNVRLIAATNRDLAEDVRRGRFREDLYYRLNVFPIRMPPLRERVEDIPLLVWTFLEDLSARMGKKITQVPRATMEALQRHGWPGNVRELRNVIENGAIITSGDTLKIPMLDDAPSGAALPKTLADVEREHIVRVLENTQGRVKGPKGAAAVLGLNPATLYSRMKKLGITPRG